MADAPKPTSWPSSFMAACVSIFIGTIALYLAVQVIKSIAVVLVISTLIVVTGWLVRTWRRRPQSSW